MNKIQEALELALDDRGESLELISKGQNQLKAIYRGRLYEDYFDLPATARHAVAEAITPFINEYNELAALYGADQAELRVAWCLFGSIDRDVDIDVAAERCSIEVSSHCRRCQYAHPFCRRILPHLTRREQECFLMMRSGLTDKEIASGLNVAPATVMKHFSNAVTRFREITGRPVNRQYIITRLFEAGI